MNFPLSGIRKRAYDWFGIETLEKSLDDLRKRGEKHGSRVRQLEALIDKKQREGIESMPRDYAVAGGIGAGGLGATSAALASKENKLRNAVITGLIAVAAGAGLGYWRGTEKQKDAREWYNAWHS